MDAYVAPLRQPGARQALRATARHAIGQRLHGAIPGSRLLVVDEAGHVPHEGIPETVRPALREFLGNTAGP